MGLMGLVGLAVIHDSAFISFGNCFISLDLMLLDVLPLFHEGIMPLQPA